MFYLLLELSERVLDVENGLEDRRLEHRDQRVQVVIHLVQHIIAQFGSEIISLPEHCF